MSRLRDVGALSGGESTAPQSGTFAALAESVAGDRRVCGAVGMPGRAMRRGGIPGRDGLAAQQVFSARHRLEMLRVDATGVAAQMVKLESRRDWSDHLVVDGDVGEHHALSIAPSANLAIAEATFRRQPFPALVIRALPDLGPEPFAERRDPVRLRFPLLARRLRGFGRTGRSDGGIARPHRRSVTWFACTTPAADIPTEFAGRLGGAASGARLLGQLAAAIRLGSTRIRLPRWLRSGGPFLAPDRGQASLATTRIESAAGPGEQVKRLGFAAPGARLRFHARLYHDTAWGHS